MSTRDIQVYYIVSKNGFVAKAFFFFFTLFIRFISKKLIVYIARYYVVKNVVISIEIQFKFALRGS